MRVDTLALLLVATSLGAADSSPTAIERTRINDNRVAAGTLRAGVLTLRLEARVGMWHPDGDDAPGAALPAFAEEGRAPRIPGPLIRVRAGTEVVATVRAQLGAEHL